MRLGSFCLAMALAFAETAYAGPLTFSLSPSTERGLPATYPVDVPFTGTIGDPDGYDACNADQTLASCYVLDSISISFDQDVAVSHLSADPDDLFDSDVAGYLFSDATGEIFGIGIAPNTPVGTYTGTATVMGYTDNTGTDVALASAEFTLDVVAPEPAAFGLAVLGLGALLFVSKRRVAA